MDIPALVVLISFVLYFGVIAISKYIGVKKLRSHLMVTGVLFLIWFVMSVVGENGSLWAGNNTCDKYLGCVDGFFGYEAFEHILFGITGSIIVMRICALFPKYSILHPQKWKNILMVVSIVMLVSVFWEMIECAHDVFRVYALHESLLNFRKDVNLLDQPSNLDTMGDLTFAFLGSVVGFFL